MASTKSTTTRLVGKMRAPKVGELATDFWVDTPSGRTTMRELAARAGTLVLLTCDSYRYHPG